MPVITTFKSSKLPLFGPGHGAVIEPGSKTIVLAGQVGTIDNEGNMAKSFEKQVTATFENVATALAEVGATPRDIAHMRYYIVNPKTKDLDKFRNIRADFFARYPGTAPAGTLIGVAELVTPEILFEVDVMAAKAPDSKL